jgi:hypothetical protein
MSGSRNETPHPNPPADVDEQLMNEDDNFVHQDEPSAY